MDNDGLRIPPDILRLPPEQMRELGYWVVDRVIEHLESLEVQPALQTGDAGVLRGLLDEGVPFLPHDVRTDLQTLADVVLANQQHGDHPRYFARVPGPSSFPAILGEWLGVGMQSIASSWVGGSGPTTLELTVLDWLRDAIGLPASAAGLLVSGGSMANATAFVAARVARGPGIVYLSDQTHSSIARGLRSLGWSDNEIRVLPSSAEFATDLSGLAAAIADDRAAGRRPMMVVATAGSTNTGAMDDLPGIADLCAREHLWLHVDGAYGGAAALSRTQRPLFEGLERIDSFTMDPHKWLFQPYDVACVWTRESGVLERAFAMYPEYLADLRGAHTDLHNRGFELSRRSRALKLWLTLRAYGVEVLGDAIDRGVALAEYAQRVVEEDPNLQVISRARLGVVTFAAPDRDAAAHVRAAAILTDSGFAAVSSTVLHGRTVLRLCIINPRTTVDDVEQTIRRLSAALAD